MEGPVGGCVKIWGALLPCIDELLFNRYLKLIRIAISWKSSSTIKKPCLRLEGKRTGRVGSQRSSGHLELKPWVFRIRQEQGLPCSSDIGGLFLLLLFGGFLMHKLCINSAHQNCSLPPPHTHCLWASTYFSLIRSDCYIWDGVYWCEKSHLVSLINPEITAEVKEWIGEREESGEKCFSQLQLHPHSPQVYRRNGIAWLRVVNWVDFPQGFGWGGKEGRRQFNCISSLSDLSHFNLCSLWGFSYFLLLLLLFIFCCRLCVQLSNGWHCKKMGDFSCPAQ